MTQSTQATEIVMPSREFRTVRDMVRSLVVLLIPIAVIVVLYRARGGEDVVVVDPVPTVAEARAAGLPASAPNGLADGWRPISAGFDPSGGGTLRIGYLTPSGAGVQLIESGVPADPLLIREIGDDVRVTGPVTAGSAEWQSYRARNDDTALVRRGSAVTLIVIGQASVGELGTLAAALP
jgi:hypothetical protein